MAEKKKADYRSFIGFVKFEPRESEVEVRGEDVTVRSVVIREVGVKEQAIDVRATFWPSHDHVEIKQGDLIAIEGPFTVKKGKNSDDEPVTYFNLSVSRVTWLGHSDTGVRDDDDDDTDEAPARKPRRESDGGSEDEPW